jgi:hypothetical protein
LPIPILPIPGKPAPKEPPPPACENGSCGAAIKNQVDSNGNKLDALQLLLQGLDLALLKVIDNKLNPQLPGGISSHLKRFTKWLQLDRVLNILTWINTLHNAYMLSSSLGDTLFSVVDNIANFFFQDEDGVDIDAKKIFGGYLDEVDKNIFGLETWKGMKTTWKQWNRIYQAAANIANTVRSMIDSVRNIAEFTAENTGKIGNALKKFGAIGEKAFKWMPEHVNGRSIWMQRLENLEDAASGLEMVTSEMVSVQDNFKELQDQKKEFEKSIDY